MPSDRPVCGNISPMEHFAKGTPEEMHQAVCELVKACHPYPHFVLSSGCDIPPTAKWDNIHAFFKAAQDAQNEVSL